MRNGILFFMMIALVLASGCVTPPASPQPPALSPTPPAAPTPTFILLAPEDGQVFATVGEGRIADIPVSLSTFDFVVRPVGPRNTAGEGHFVLQLDGEAPLHTYSKQYTLRNVPAGEHRLTVQLVHNDNAPYDPEIVQTARFIVVEPVQPPKTYAVKIAEFTYEPSELAIRQGDTVAWTNVGTLPRTVTSTNNFNSATLTPGQNFSHTFDRPGVYEYFSVNYPSLKGRIVVQKS